MVIEIAEQKGKAIRARNTTFDRNWEIRRKILPIFGSKMAKSDYFQDFYFSQSVLKSHN